MIEFIRKKLENLEEFKALKKYLETGVIISGILTIGTMLIYLYKFWLLSFIGIPFQVSKSIVDVQIMRCDSDSGKKLIKSMVLRTADRQGMC